MTRFRRLIPLMAAFPLLSSALRRVLLPLLLVHSMNLPAESDDASLPSAEDLRAALDGREGTIVLREVATGRERIHGQALADEGQPPCSTFKIWNTLIGLEEGLLQDGDQAFWKWDGVQREIEEWNRDLTLAESFRFSCVPAYQALARRIGQATMHKWIERLDYGDKNHRAGLDVFWLPAQGRRSLLITPRRQAELLADWAAGRLPFREETNRQFRTIFLAREDARGKLYGKTGSGMGTNGKYVLGWFVGVFESAKGQTAFACLLRGEGLSGRDARRVVETIFPLGK